MASVYINITAGPANGTIEFADDDSDGTRFVVRDSSTGLEIARVRDLFGSYMVDVINGANFARGTWHGVATGLFGDSAVMKMASFPEG